MRLIKYYVVYWRDKYDHMLHSANFSGWDYSNKCGFVRDVRNNGGFNIETHCHWDDGEITKIKE